MLNVEITGGPYAHNENDWQAISYHVRLLNDDIPVLETDYKLGIGHVKLTWSNTRGGLSREEGYFLKAWQGKPHANFQNKDMQLSVAVKLAKAQKLKPKKEDVIYSLLSDGQPCFDDMSFEDWATDFGYDIDSIKAKAIYDQCFCIGLKIVQAIGRDNVEKLREEYQDY